MLTALLPVLDQQGGPKSLLNGPPARVGGMGGACTHKSTHAHPSTSQKHLLVSSCAAVDTQEHPQYNFDRGRSAHPSPRVCAAGRPRGCTTPFRSPSHALISGRLAAWLAVPAPLLLLLLPVRASWPRRQRRRAPVAL
jgi:hypothetical protein